MIEYVERWEVWNIFCAAPGTYSYVGLLEGVRYVDIPPPRGIYLKRNRTHKNLCGQANSANFNYIHDHL